MAAPATLSVRGLGVRYGDRTAVSGVDMDLEGGRSLAILGPNGAGKTSLVRAILGLVRPAEGEVRVDGHDVHALPRRELARLLACVPQDAPLSFPYTVREVVAMGRYAHRERFRPAGPRDLETVEGAIARVGIGALADRPVTELSGGERQLTAIARAVAQEPRFLVLDEPTANLDVAHVLHVFRVLRELAAEGVGVLGVVHDMDLAARHFDRVALLAGGRLDALGPPDDVLTPQRLGRVFGVEARVHRVDGGSVFRFG